MFVGFFIFISLRIQPSLKMGKQHIVVVLYLFPDMDRLGKHHMEMLAGMQNETATSGTSAYGKKLMEKMGWTS